MNAMAPTRPAELHLELSLSTLRNGETGDGT